MLAVAEWLLCVGLVFGPVLGYIPQYREIQTTRHSAGFSTLVCFILLVSNILRIFFWIGERFEYALLFQSIVMIFAQLAMLELIIRLELRRKPHRHLEQNYQLRRFSMSKFWSWDYFGEYLAFILAFVGTAGILTILNETYLHSSMFVQSTGFLALMIEATLGIPQLVQNYRNHSTRGLRYELILTWFVGDAFKTAFFIFRHSPLQFVLCGMIQVAVDLAIGIQMLHYNKRSRVGGNKAYLEASSTRARASAAALNAMRDGSEGSRWFNASKVVSKDQGASRDTDSATSVTTFEAIELTVLKAPEPAFVR